MEDSWSRWAVLSRKDEQPPIILAAYEMGRNMQLFLKRVTGEALFPAAFSEELKDKYEFVTLVTRVPQGRMEDVGRESREGS